MLDEKDLIRRYKKEHLRAMWVDFQNTGNGVPDLYFIESNGVSWWAEFKFVYGDKKLELKKHMFRPQQISMLCNLLCYGQDVRVILGNKDYYIEIGNAELEKELNRLLEE